MVEMETEDRETEETKKQEMEVAEKKEKEDGCSFFFLFTTSGLLFQWLHSRVCWWGRQNDGRA